jgi:RHS repeat-associated protein
MQTRHTSDDLCADTTNCAAYNYDWGAMRVAAKHYSYDVIARFSISEVSDNFFATHNRNSCTTVDYADQRFYASTYGRFNTPDPYKASGSTRDPGSWNRYAYVGGDPVNFGDPSGLERAQALPNPYYSGNGGPCDSSTDLWNGCDYGDTFPGSYYGCSNLSSSAALLSVMAEGGVCASFYAESLNMQLGPVPSCVQSAITGAAQSVGLDLNNFQNFSVQIVGSNGATETELNMTGTRADVQQLINSMCAADFYSTGDGACPNGATSSGVVGTPHDGYTGNFRQPGATGSLQVNTNLSAGAIQMDVDPFNPAAGPLGVLAHSILQWLPNKITGMDNSYGCPSAPLP